MKLTSHLKVEGYHKLKQISRFAFLLQFISLFKSWKIPSFTSDDQYKLSKWLTDICDSMILVG